MLGGYRCSPIILVHILVKDCIFPKIVLCVQWFYHFGCGCGGKPAGSLLSSCIPPVAAKFSSSATYWRNGRLLDMTNHMFVVKEQSIMRRFVRHKLVDLKNFTFSVRTSS